MAPPENRVTAQCPACDHSLVFHLAAIDALLGSAPTSRFDASLFDGARG